MQSNVREGAQPQGTGTGAGALQVRAQSDEKERSSHCVIHGAWTWVFAQPFVDARKANAASPCINKRESRLLGLCTVSFLDREGKSGWCGNSCGWPAALSAEHSRYKERSKLLGLKGKGLMRAQAATATHKTSIYWFLRGKSVQSAAPLNS
eukprot:1158010-Pelagomonas_calceolata.AAC.14